MQQDKFFSNLIWWKQMTDYKMKTADISMLINIHIQNKQKSYILRNLCFLLFEILTFSALWVGSYHNFTYVSSGMYVMIICGKNCNKTVYSYKNNTMYFHLSIYKIQQRWFQSIFSSVACFCYSMM